MRLEDEVWEVIALEVRADGWKIHISFVTTLVLFLVLQKSKLPCSKPFICLCNYIRFTWEISTMGCGLLTCLAGWHLVLYNWTQLGWSSDIASEWTLQKTPFLSWCGWHGIMCSIAAALSTWTMWQHRFWQLFYYCVTSPWMWHVPLLRVQSLLLC
jgi:hypothetical protein